MIYLLKCLKPFSTVFQIYRGGQCTFPCFSGVLLTSIPHYTLSKPQAAFPLNHCRNNGQRLERNESCRNDYHQSSERILAEPWIEPATSCSQVRNATDYGARQSRMCHNRRADTTIHTPRKCRMACKKHDMIIGLTFPKQGLVFTCLHYKSFENSVGKGELLVTSSRLEPATL